MDRRPPTLRPFQDNEWRQLLPGVDGRSTWVRWLRHLIELHVEDQGGADNLSVGSVYALKNPAGQARMTHNRGPIRQRAFRPTRMTALGVTYVAGILPNSLMWPSGAGPRRRCKPMNNTARRDEPDLVSAREVALALPKRAWCTIRWREGTANWLSSRFARVRVGVGHNRLLPELLSREWLLIEWPDGEV